MPSSVEALVLELLDKLQAFDRLLRVEQDCLLQAAVDQLPALTEQKTALLLELDALEQQRLAAFDQHAGAHTCALWLRVQALAKRISGANQRNGAMILALVRNTEGALHILRGTSADVGLYGAQGHGQAGGAAARLLVSA